jgi:hypothetical protein
LAEAASKKQQSFFAKNVVGLMLQPLTFKEGEGQGLYTLLQVWGTLTFLRDAPA